MLAFRKCHQAVCKPNIFISPAML